MPRSQYKTFMILGDVFADTSQDARIILCMRPANEKWLYNVTSLIGWVHTQNDPCGGFYAGA